MNPILEKIKKLLKLADRATNPHEAANAAARAAEMMAAHKIEMADLKIDGAEARASEPVEIHMEPGENERRFKKLAPWRGALMAAVVHSFGCASIRRGGSLGIVGRRADAQAAQYVFDYLVLEIERLATAGAAQRRLAPGGSMRWKNSFRMGAAWEIQERLEREKARRESDLAQAAANPHALMVLREDEAAVDAFIGSIPKARARKRSHDWDGVRAGKNAAASITLGPGRGAIEASKKRIGGAA